MCLSLLMIEISTVTQLGHLTYSVTDGGSNNWIYALTLVIIFRNVL